ncbi:alcohol dehydrogenase [Mammaliicoccus sciuri]|uniref:iron-containing alcohol dehydrogenase n=1 Tax=Mammaliicoccus sciuri TaxID=1296 RepID=UPI0009FD6D18|nr:iron-containing alcohol dehydrogenase [Mammaliicoccus sciuri]ORI01671.1 alcohol dehydrogenase [Mammaliicoccus sciuri]
MLRDYSLKMPKNIYAGEHALERLENIINEGVNKIAIFTSDGLINLGLVENSIQIIKKLGIDYTLITGIPPEPNYHDAQAAIDTFKKEQADFIIALGGGSIMDVAKLASILSTDEYTVKDLLDDPLLAKKQIPTLMIPTTAGTGAEATPNAIVGVPEKDLKIGIVNDDMIADYVILDGRLTQNLPKDIAAATGLDALCHAIECYTSEKANPISNMFALEALDLILDNIVEACTNKEALKAKSNMLLGAFYGGVAITASGTTAVHALSYPLGGKYHIAHGVSNAILLTPVMKFNEPYIKELLAEVYDRIEQDNGGSIDEKSAHIIRKLEEIVKVLEIPTSLKQYEITEADVDGLVAAGMEVTRLLVNNKREVTPEDARKIYLEVI